MSNNIKAKPENLLLFPKNEYKEKTLDLKPAKWIWYPSQRTLQNTFFLFRKEFFISGKPIKAKGWIFADSRYLLYVNGKRIQWGPAPSDPRWVEVDPLDITETLQIGENIIAAQVLYYGQGDGTWPIGKPGFIFYLQIDHENNLQEIIVSDNSWKVCLPGSWKPGHYKRWYVRSLQEEFDARLFPFGWNQVEFTPDNNWINAMILSCPSDKPPSCSTYPEYMYDILGKTINSELRKRSVPVLKEYPVKVKELSEAFWIKWKRSPEEYFEFLTPDSFEVDGISDFEEIEKGVWQIQLNENNSVALTFEMGEQIVGWPYFSIDASEGTTIELMVQEGHKTGGPVILNTHFHSWTRFICKEGMNHFETFDFESCKWLQLLVRNSGKTITLSNVGVRRRIFPWQNEPKISTSDKEIQKLINASINTLNNCAQETLVDGMGRERQQYSGDCGHQIHAIYSTFGETRSPARFIKTYSQGLTLDGYFLDCWPAYDRLARLMERELQLTEWGPLLDHGIGLNFDSYYHYLYTGDLNALNETYPRLLKFSKYLQSIRCKNDLLPVENIGVPSVWIDHEAYTHQHHKQCAFNLYAAAMLKYALAPLCKAFNDIRSEQMVKKLGKEILTSTIKHFWSKRYKTFINNLPWIRKEKEIRLCDRSLATAILFDQCPDNKIDQSLKYLVECPKEMGYSYPANAGWRLWALAKCGRTDIILNDLREKWATMNSVILNNTLQEFWKTEPDSESQWSHCAVAPLYILFMGIVGIKPLIPGFSRCEIRPQLDNLEKLNLTCYTVNGPIQFKSNGEKGNREIMIKLPKNCEGELVVSNKEKINHRPILLNDLSGNSRYYLKAGIETIVILKFT